MYRTYVYKLKPTKRQQLIFNSLFLNLEAAHRSFLNIFKETPDGWLIQYTSQKSLISTENKFTPYFINTVLEQVAFNFDSSANKESFQSIFPIVFKGTKFSKDFQKIDFPFMKKVSLSHSREFNGRPLSFKLFYKNGSFFVHVLIEFPAVSKKNNNLSVVGIDMGLKSFMTLSNNVAIDNPRFERRFTDRLKYHQNKLSSKTINSKAWKKEVGRINSLYAKIKHQRLDFFHQISNYLIGNFDVIGIENLAISELQSNKHLRLSLKDAAWGEFIRILEYKCENNGVHLIRVGRFFPSSQICSCCGSRKFMPVYQRIYECVNCKKTIERDYNASINIEREALRIFNNL